MSETSTGVPRLFTCVAKYDMIHLCYESISLRSHIALRPPGYEIIGWEHLFLPRELLHTQARFFPNLLLPCANVILFSTQEHTEHSCGMRMCPASCDMCKRLCIQPHHHGMKPGESHLCG
jgi:hypothetical protein